LDSLEAFLRCIEDLPFVTILAILMPKCQFAIYAEKNIAPEWPGNDDLDSVHIKPPAMDIQVKMATGSGSKWPPIGAKRRWMITISPCGRIELMESGLSA